MESIERSQCACVKAQPVMSSDESPFIDNLRNFIVTIVFWVLGVRDFSLSATYTHHSLLRISPTLLPPLSLLQYQPGS